LGACSGFLCSASCASKSSSWLHPPCLSGRCLPPETLMSPLTPSSVPVRMSIRGERAIPMFYLLLGRGGTGTEFLCSFLEGKTSQKSMSSSAAWSRLLLMVYVPSHSCCRPPRRYPKVCTLIHAFTNLLSAKSRRVYLLIISGYCQISCGRCTCCLTLSQAIHNQVCTPRLRLKGHTYLDSKPPRTSSFSGQNVLLGTQSDQVQQIAESAWIPRHSSCSR
jgi:hypothetical protein